MAAARQRNHCMQNALLLALTVLFNVLGQVFIKQGMTVAGTVEGEASAVVQTFLRGFTTPWIWAGLAAYGLGSLLWMAVLSRVDLSIAYPALSLGYILIVLVSWLALREPVSALRWLGVLVITVGVFLVARS